jgi:hypothetical protein
MRVQETKLKINLWFTRCSFNAKGEILYELLLVLSNAIVWLIIYIENGYNCRQTLTCDTNNIRLCKNSIIYIRSSNPVHGEVYSIQHYVIMFVSDLRQAGVFFRVLRFPAPKKKNWPPRYNCNIVESGVKDHSSNP